MKGKIFERYYDYKGNLTDHWIERSGVFPKWHADAERGGSYAVRWVKLSEVENWKKMQKEKGIRVV